MAQYGAYQNGIEFYKIFLEIETRNDENNGQRKREKKLTKIIKRVKKK